MACKKTSLASLALVLVLAALVGRSDGQLTSGFYDGKCGNTSVEQFVFNLVQSKMKASDPGPGLVGDLTRLSFHDCFVRVSNLDFFAHIYCLKFIHACLICSC